MKKTFFTLLLFLAATAVNAQIVKGDMGGNGKLTVADATSVVDVVLGNAPQENINPNTVDNTLVAGTWLAPDGTRFTLAADGTTSAQLAQARSTASATAAGACAPCGYQNEHPLSRCSYP